MSDTDKMKNLEQLVNLPNKTFLQLLQIRNLSRDLQLQDVEKAAQKEIDAQLAYSKYKDV